MRIIILHPTGNQNVRAITEALAEAALLEKFYTCVAVFKNNVFYNLLNFNSLRELRRRTFPPILRAYTYTRPFRELGRLASGRLGWKNGTMHERGIFCIDNIYRDLDLHVSKRIKNVCAVYAYEDGALQSFEKARLNGVNCLYDLPTGYWRAKRQLLEKERKERPDWAMTLKYFQDSDVKLHRKDRELALADVIFVASNFTKETLGLYPGALAPIQVIPYGFPPIFKERTYKRLKERKLKLLFVGGLSQAKGIANVLEAVNSLQDELELTIVGRKITDNCIPLEEGLKKYTWIPSLPHDQILKLMQSQDVFIFPSLFEGYGLVITEAMSQGTPVITTKRTCGADFINDGENGWLVEPGNTNSLKQKLKNILANPEQLKKVGKAAMATAEKLPLSIYGEKMVEAICTEVNKD